MLLSAEHISLNFGLKQLLEDVTLYLNEGDKIGIIGINGTGKSSLLRVLAGQQVPDQGTVSLDPNVQVCFLPQNPAMVEGATVLEQVFHDFSPDTRALLEYEAKAMLTRLGITDFTQPVDTLSGGQRKRVALAAALIHPADVLILDEPTNHLDSEMVAWLEDRLRKFTGGLIMVTHDRYFLERVCNRITELSHCRIRHYEANYSKYLEQKTQQEEMDQAAQRKRQSILRVEYQWIMRGAQARRTKNKDRIARYEELKAQAAPETDGAVEEYLAIHGRPEAYEALHPQEGAYYDSLITIDLSKVEPMAALPFHPAEAYPIRELMANPGDIFREVEKRTAEQFGGKVTLSLTDKLVDGKIVVDQGIIAGCAGGMYDNIAEAAAILDGHDVGSGYFSLSIYPPSVPVNLELIHNGVQQSLLEAGALFKPCFCGPCFGAGDVPANNGLSIRHTTRNFPNREGSKPGDGQLSGVVLMDARSIAATARNHGVLTPATEVSYVQPKQGKRTFDQKVYDRRVYFGFGHPQPEAELKFGPNIAEWPPIPALADNMLMQVASVLRDPVTTTDELIPSGETSSYRSNPLKLASFALSRRDPDYVPRAQATQALETGRQAGVPAPEVQAVLEQLGQKDLAPEAYQIGSVIFANKPGDGSAREQAASCQRVLGGCANICYEFATKRYRSNCVNWGMLPFTLAEGEDFPCAPGDYIFVPDVKAKVLAGEDTFPALALTGGEVKPLTLYLKNTTAEERELLLTGCLMNHYAAQNKA